MSIWGWLKLTIAVWLFRQALKVTRWLIVAAVAVAAWPVTIVAVAGYAAAWLRGWPPARLWRAAGWSLPMTAVYFIGQGLRLRSWAALALAPVNDWADAWRLLAAHAILRAGLLVAPVAVPAGFALTGVGWAWRIYAVTTGLAGQTASAPVWFDDRQWRHQVRSARARAAGPGTVPLLTGRGLVAIGATIRAVGHRWRPVLAVPARSFSRHSVIIGSSGSGKTNLMMRLWAGWYAATHATFTRREGTGRCWSSWTAKAAPTPGPKRNGPAACCTGSGPGGWRSGRMRPGSACGTCHRGIGGAAAADDRDRRRGCCLLHRHHANRR